MNEQRIREIVREEMKKKEATAVTVTSRIDITGYVETSELAQKLLQLLDQSTRRGTL